MNLEDYVYLEGSILSMKEKVEPKEGEKKRKEKGSKVGRGGNEKYFLYTSSQMSPPSLVEMGGGDGQGAMAE